jgi:hypothetical protein
MNTKETIIAQIKLMSSEEIFDLNNRLSHDLDMHDSTIYYNDEYFFEYAFGTDVLRAVQATFYGEYNYSHEYVMFNGYGNLDSFPCLDYNNLFDILDNIVDYVIADIETYEDLFTDIEIENN